MPSHSSSDRRFLERHGTRWRVVVNVPRDLVKKLGTKLKRTLETDSLSEANLQKWDVVAELKAQFDEARNPSKGRHKKPEITRADALRHAAEIAQRRRFASDRELNDISDETNHVADEIAGKPIDTEHDGSPIYETGRAEIANEFVQLASGKKTPIDFDHEKYLAASGVKARTQADDKRAMKLLKQWCEDNGIPPFLQAIGKKEAVRFCDDLPSLAGSLSPVTLNKYVSRLSVYWSWLENRHEVDINVWTGRRLKEPAQTIEDKERPFTDDEMKALLTGDATPEMHDLMRIAALTGCRLDPIVCLSAKDCEGGTFRFKPQKREPGSRWVPIHPDLKEIVQRRTEGKEPDDPVFPEWPGVKKSNSLRERSFKTSNEFTAYRRSVKVSEERDGKRRGLVNFHSFRRWFITKAEQAGQPESTIAFVVGHKRQGMTFGVYSGGPQLEQARACVEAVKLPA